MPCMIDCLYEAAKHGRLDEFRQLVKEQRGLNDNDLQYELKLVFRFEHLHMVRYVLEECGLDVHAQGKVCTQFLFCLDLRQYHFGLVSFAVW
jgi:hypothetical protein